MIRRLKKIYILLFKIKRDFVYLVLNTVVCFLPSWNIRKILYLICGMKIGKGSRIGIGTKIDEPKGILIGNNVFINEYCHLDGRGGLIIGDSTSISIYSRIITATHKLGSSDFSYFPNTVRIGDHVWIGAGATILDGSIINCGTVIGAGCVFKGKSKEGEVYIGNPARSVKTIEPGEYKLINTVFFR